MKRPANDHIDFAVRSGEVHGLIGENGAGKTTLMNILYGLYKPSGGEIYVKGKKASISTPADAINLGIGMVQQHFALIPTLSTTENIILGREGNAVLDLRAKEKEVDASAKSHGIEIEPRTLVKNLSVGEQQRVEIMKAIYRGATLLILDEPTAVLTPNEVDQLYSFIRQMKEKGSSVIFISHKLDEATTICDRITVLRDGKVISTVEGSEANKADLAKKMVGRDVVFRRDKKMHDFGKVVFEVKNLKVLNDEKLLGLKGVSLCIHEGEILGIAGVDGNGQTELAEAAAGVRRIQQGEILVDGLNLTNKPTRRFVEHGVAYIPADRNKYGIIPGFSIVENCTLKIFRNPVFYDRFFLKTPKIEEYTKQLVSEYNIHISNINEPVKNLSGGNVQKLILARQFFGNPKLIIAEQPTRGLDVDATEYVHRQLLTQAEKGAAVLLISATLDEILELSDNMAVIYEGEIMGMVRTEEADIREIGMMMAGSRTEGSTCS